MPSTIATRIAEGNDYVTRHVYALESRMVNDLYAAYQQAYRELQDRVVETFNNLPSDRWSVADLAARESLLAQIGQQMAMLDEQAASLVFGQMLDAYKGGAYGTAWILESGLMQAAGRNLAAIPLLPNEVVRAQLLAPYVGQTFVDRFRDNRAEFDLRIKRSLVQSQIQGESVYQAQRRIAAELGIAIARRTKADRASNKAAFARTEMIARTELLRASNNGALAVYEANSDVLKGWEWKTALDERTCAQCAPLDGRQYEFGAVQRPPLHPRCRCAVLPTLINQRLQDAIAGERVTFKQWAEKRGISRNQYGQMYDLRGQDAPVKPAA